MQNKYRITTALVALFLIFTYTFSTAHAIMQSNGGVTSVTVTAPMSQIMQGASTQFSATVEVWGDATSEVVWSVDLNSASISQNGFLTVPEDTPVGTLITVTAASVYDPTVSGDAVITVSELLYTVIFYGYGCSMISIQHIPYGGSALEPEPQAVEGMTFIGWDTDFTYITGNTYISPIYEANVYTVEFLDWDDSILSTQQIEHYYDATPPADPTRDNYSFIGWDTDYECIIKDTTIRALYEPLYPGIIGDINGDGFLNIGDAAALLRYVVGLYELPENRLFYCDANGDGVINSGDAAYILNLI